MALSALAGIVSAGLAGLVALGGASPELLLATLGICAALAVVTAPRRTRAPKRLAVIGRQTTAVSLEQALACNRVDGYELVGWIACGAPATGELFPLPDRLGTLQHLAPVVEEHGIDLLLIGSDVPRMSVFDEMVTLMDVSAVRVCELSAFYEQQFGHIPVEEINSAWFQYLMHPRYGSAAMARAKRVFDVSLAAAMAVVALPVLVIAAIAIKTDGGPILYRQRRIGEKGRPFMMYKLRTMREQPRDERPARWCAADDPRVTRVGDVLRRLHVDELPQLYNILRGEMSIVGPRPEQPEIATRLEQSLSFYSRRHLIKPGLTGWAQISCGYARSESGTAWKLCHDLYYIKHQSLMLDIKILVRTFVTIVSRASAEARDVPLLADGEPEIEVAVRSLHG